MSSFWRAFIVIAVGAWMLGTVVPQLSCLSRPCPFNGLSVNFDGIVEGVGSRSPAERASIVPGDRIVAPMPRDLFRTPPVAFSFRLNHSGTIRALTLTPGQQRLSSPEKLSLLALCLSYLIFLIVGSAVLLLRPSAMTWSFYLYCVLRRYGDLGFYWPGSDAFFWFNSLALAALGGATCAFVLIFALLFPSNRLEGWKRSVYRIALGLAVAFPLAWLYVFLRLSFLGLPSHSAFRLLVVLTSVVYLAAAAVFALTLAQSHGDERQRLRWIVVFPVVLVMRVVAIDFPHGLWLSYTLAVLGVCVPLAVAYAVVRRRVFDIEFAISRALVYGAITSIIAGTFILLDWFMSRQFAQTRFTLTAEIIVALALGSWLNMLHKNVDRFVDSTFFRARHLAEQRLARAAAALRRAESHEAVDRFLVYEPMQAFNLTSAALFHREQRDGRFVRRVGLHWDYADVLTPEDPLVLHLLAEGAPTRLADVTWLSAEVPKTGNAVLAVPILLRDELVTIALYGPHRNGADIDPDEVRSLEQLGESAGAAYDHIEARLLRQRVEDLTRERDAKAREVAMLLARPQGS
jgi:hypothetical protein